jgi:hypothetical protein
VIPGLDGKVPKQVLGLAGVDGAVVKGDSLVVTCDGAARAAVVSAVTEAGLKISDMRTMEPSLEEAFVKLVSNDRGAA